MNTKLTQKLLTALLGDALTTNLSALAETFTFNATFDNNSLYSPNWSGSGGTPTSGNMGSSGTCVVGVDAQLFGPAPLSGNSIVNSNAVLTMTFGSKFKGTGVAIVNGRLIISGVVTSTIAPALVLSNAIAGRVLEIAARGTLQDSGSVTF